MPLHPPLVHTGHSNLLSGQAYEEIGLKLHRQWLAHPNTCRLYLHISASHFDLRRAQMLVNQIAAELRFHPNKLLKPVIVMLLAMPAVTSPPPPPPPPPHPPTYFRANFPGSYAFYRHYMSTSSPTPGPISDLSSCTRACCMYVYVRELYLCCKRVENTCS